MTFLKETDGKIEITAFEPEPNPVFRERRPVIGIPAALSTRPQTGYTYQQVGASYARALEEVGALPVLLPVTGRLELVGPMLKLVDGIMLQGGNDIAPRLYGQEQVPEVTQVNETTDEFELEVCRQCLEMDIPLLAICRGIQVLNVAMGGTLVQDLPTSRELVVPHRQPESRDTPTHLIRLTPESTLAEILGRPCLTVNSFHHQAIDHLAEGLKVSAVSEDDIIEGVEVPGKQFVIGVQFHPEETVQSVPATRELFRRLVEAAKNRREGLQSNSLSCP